MKKVAIIGAGYTGMACAKKLIENNFEVDIYEASSEVGGMAKCIKKDDFYIENHYRHIYRSDKYIIDLINELNINNNLQWLDTQMAYYSSKGLYKFGTPISLLTYKPLNFVEKIKFGMCIIHLKLIKDYKSLEKYTVKEWIIKHYGQGIYSKIWEPLMSGKFGDEKDKISMTWLWGKINLRSTNTTMKGEKLGYYKGSWKGLNDKLYSYLIENGCKIKLNEEVVRAYKNNEKYVIETNCGKYDDYDNVVCTVSYNLSEKILEDVLDVNEKEKMKRMKYISAKTVMMQCKKDLSKYYWINIGDKEIPFVGIIEHTNMVNKSNYNDNHIIYISNYIDKDNILYKKSGKELVQIYLPYLKLINPDFNEDDIIDIQVAEEDDAQPVVGCNYSDELLGYKLKSGIFMANMAQIYPEDRGMNYAVQLGYKIADEIK